MTDKNKKFEESLPIAYMLALSGGFFDAYTYVCRDGVFANAQTGNIVMFGINIADLNFRQAFLFLIPIIAFTVGVFTTEILKKVTEKSEIFNFHTIILQIEAFLLLVVSFLPKEWNIAANVMISFVCSLQVDAFRKWHGHTFATTMCTGNLRTATELAFKAYSEKKKDILKTSIVYFSIIFIFVAGAASGFLLTNNFEYKAILFSLLPILVTMKITERKNKST